MIKYIGSKRRLLGAIVAAVDDLGGPCTVLDLFSGSARVAHALKAAGHRVVANDMNRYAEVLARAHVVADRARWQAPAEALVGELRSARPTPPPRTDDPTAPPTASSWSAGPR